MAGDFPARPGMAELPVRHDPPGPKQTNESAHPAVDGAVTVPPPGGHRACVGTTPGLGSIPGCKQFH
jgi:hypothetical protein